jgi:DNA-3-methyladenine glycosylase I
LLIALLKNSFLGEKVQEHEQWQIPKWWYREERPKSDNAYFENMCRVIFQAGLNWQVIDNKWSTTKKSFANFNINKVACFTPADVQHLMRDAGIVRNKSKIEAIIKNAQRFKILHKQFGSFQAYIDSLDKSNNYANAVKDLASKFEHVGPTSANLFLYTVGEKIDPWD